MLSAGLLSVIVLLLGAAYAMNVWHRAMFDGLQNRDAAAVGRLSLIYFVILAVSVGAERVPGLRAHDPAAALARVAEQPHRRPLARATAATTSSIWCPAITPIPSTASPTTCASPPNRRSTSSAASRRRLLSAATFIVVLWTIGGALDCHVGGWQLHIPGFLVIAALVYALMASGSMVLIGSRFVQASENKNQAEAEYRYVITRLRENGESIALIRGEEEERAGVDRSLRKVLAAWRDIAIQNMKTTSRLADLGLHRARCCRSSCARPSSSTARCRSAR